MAAEAAPRRWSLRRRLVAGLFGYIAFLTSAIALHGYIFNERAEALVWGTLLQTELDHVVERRHAGRAVGNPDEKFEVFSGATMPPAIAALAPGVHDEVVVDGRERVMLVREVDGERIAVALDIDDLERMESNLGTAVVLSTTLLIALLAGVSIWGVGRWMRPLQTLAGRIAALDPRHGQERLPTVAGGSEELVIIANAMNAYLERNERFIEREREFLHTASHELRSPIAVIAGAAQNALGDATLSAPARAQVARIRRTATDVESLLALLLVLAKDPARLADISERVALHELIGPIVEDHRHLCTEKALSVRIAESAPCHVHAPAQIVRAAVGNLLRNAIENSDRGEIVIRLDPHACVRIDDPGHGMTPEEISQIHSRLARGGERDGGGIGLALIGRLCEHLGWRLDIASVLGRGSHVSLDFAPGKGPASQCSEAEPQG